MRTPALGISITCLMLALGGMLMEGTSVQAKTAAQAPIPAPPEPVFEVEPGERPGYTWSPGYWQWNGARHVWTSGQWIANRPGYTWMPNGWERRGDTWRFARGHWEKSSEEAVEEEETAENEPTISGSKAVATGSPARMGSETPKKPVKRHKTTPNYRNERLYPPVTQH